MQLQSPVPPEPSSSGEIKRVLVALCLAIVAGIAIFIFFSRELIWSKIFIPATRQSFSEQVPPARLSDGVNSTHESILQLQTENGLYIAGEQLLRQGDHLGAREKLNKAVSSALNLDQEAQILFLIALTYEPENPLETVRKLREIADNREYNGIMRATAVHQMFATYRKTADEPVLEEIFKGDPYQTLFVPENIDASAINLYTYAESLYPLAIVEYTLADLYANELIMHSLQAAESVAPEDPVAARFGEELKTHFAKGEEDLVRIRNQNRDDPRLIDALQVKARVMGKVRNFFGGVGVGTRGETEEVFKEGIRIARDSERPGSEAFLIYDYAIFLSRAYAPGTRDNDIRSLLSSFYLDDRFEKTTIYEFLRNAATPQGHMLSGMRVNSLKILADIDPKFAELLRELGWSGV